MYTIEQVTEEPKVILGKYKGIEVTARSNEVTEEELQALIREACRQMAQKKTISDRLVTSGDTICLDFAGYLDGTAFDGGTAEQYELVIGSGSFIPGFEEQLIGAMPGSEVDVRVTFPANYQAAELAGKDTLFKCKVHHILETIVPEADDAFARSAGFDSMEVFRTAATEQLAKKKTAANQDAQYVEAMRQIVEDAELIIPDTMLQEKCSQMVEELSQTLARQGMTLEQYCQYTGLTKENLEEQARPQALENLQSRLILLKIAEAEDLMADEEELNARFAELAQEYAMDAVKVEQLLGKQGRTLLLKDIAVEKAMEFIMENIVEK